MTRSPPEHLLTDLADPVAEEFSHYRHPDEFNTPSLVIDNSNPKRSTLIIHIDRKHPADFADRLEAFLHDNGARTQRERHSDTDISLGSDALTTNPRGK